VWRRETFHGVESFPVRHRESFRSVESLPVAVSVTTRERYASRMALGPENPDNPRLVAAYPQALVADVARAADFYRDKLGFRVVYLYGAPPFYGLVERGGARINLRHVDAPARYRPEAEEDVLTANIPVEGIKALFLELRARGVAFAQTLQEQPWGASDFLVRDPDGNLLCFASAV
jgi:catechol 2,3-dioxygenase-like lactoylglutathione lyase family enzyme